MTPADRLLPALRLLAAAGVAAVAVAATAALIAVALPAGARSLYAYQPVAVPELEPLATRSVILAADGTEIGVLYDEDREPVVLADVPRVVIDAVVAAEDEDFFDHAGFDVPAIMRAALSNAKAGDVSQGGSTITQQLVKNTFLTPEQTIERKLEELTLAVRLEQELSKEEILERYLNTIYFGNGAYGVRAAAERYFGKDVGQLGVAEAALVAGLIAAPEELDPIDQPEAAERRRAQVLDQMVAAGHLHRAAADRAAATPLPTQIHQAEQQTDSWFVEEVKRQLLADRRLGATKAERFDAVFRGGLRIHTTLDPRIQAAADRAVAEHLPASEFTTAFAAIEPATGAVRAVVGGPGADRAGFNLATQGRRQAGSAFKLVTLAAALEAGRSPEDPVDGTAPCELNRPGWTEPWKVDNYEGGGGSVMTLREATVRSANCAYARAVLDIGPERVAGMAERLGVGRSLDAVPSITLGTQEVSPIEMSTMLATLANDGVRVDPWFIKRVEDEDGNVVFRHEPRPRQVVDPEVARSVNEVLQDVVQRGTGRAAILDRPVAGKTGTAQEWRDAWFAGYTRQLAAAVWMGAPVGQISMKGVAGRNVTGGSFPAQIWAGFMRAALEGTPGEAFVAPDRSRWPSPTPLGEFSAPIPFDLLPEEDKAALAQLYEDTNRREGADDSTAGGDTGGGDGEGGDASGDDDGGDSRPGRGRGRG